ncbi:retrovirus-related pol polyprotein from transposon TNT 1-94 [Tanacetum coccineum]
MFKDLKKFQAELDRYHDVNYASKVEITCAKAKGELISYKMSSEKSFNEYTQKMNDLNQTISELKKELIAHQESISIMSQEKEAQNKFYKTREDKEIEKVIALENKVKVLDDIVYKTGQSVQTMNMLNRNCKTSFVKPEFLKKAQRSNPRMHDIGCYNDNHALMLAPESEEMIRLAQERVIPTTSASRPQLKSNRLENRVMHNNSQGKMQQVEDHSRNFKFSSNKMFSIDVLVSTKETKRNVSQSVATPLKKTIIADSTNQKPRSTTRKQYEHVSNTCRWWYSKITPPRYKWKPKTSKVNVKPNVRNLKLLSNFVEKFLGTMKFENDQIAPIIGYGDLVQVNITIKRVYYVKGLNHNLFSVGQLCDADLEVAFWKSTCYVRDLKGNDLLTGSRGIHLYSITLQDTNYPNPICLMAKASSSQALLWHHHLSHLNFNTINLLSKYDIVIGLPKFKFVKDHLCSSCELGKAKHKVESFTGEKYVLVIVDDYSRYTWTHFLRSKDETLEVLIDFLKLVQRGLHAQVRTVRTDKGIEFLNKTLYAYFAQEGIEHQTPTARTPEQNGVVERWNRTLVEAARTMLSAAKVSLFFWAKAIATSFFTQNRSLVIPRHEKTPYHIINGRKPSVKFFYIFGSLCYIVRDGENLDKMKEKDHVSSDPVPQCPTMALEHDSLSPGPQSQENVPQAAETVTTSNELDLLFNPMFDELLNGTTQVVSKSSDVTTIDAPNQRQQQHPTPSTSTTVAADTPPLNIQTTPETTSQAPTQVTIVTATENINQVETNKKMHMLKKMNLSTSLVHRYKNEGRHHHLLEQVIGNPPQLIRIRCQLETDGEMYMLALTVSQTEPKNIKEAVADSVRIEAMQEELHQFDR